MPEPTPVVSVIIPTYNRKESLLRTLDSLARQTYPADRMEVIVVDDGSTDGTTDTSLDRRLTGTVLHAEHGGATAARNHGASRARGCVLVFVDDDIELEADALAQGVRLLQSLDHAILLGTLSLPDQRVSQVLVCGRFEGVRAPGTLGEVAEVPFQHCMTGLLFVRQPDLAQIGGFQDPTGGWPNWDDVDFGYRATGAGYRLFRSTLVRATHWDHVSADLRSACDRWYRAAHAGARLFQRYPELQGQIPMFADKGPVRWGEDSVAIIARKAVRSLASSQPAQALIRWFTMILERCWPNFSVLTHLYNWQVSACIRKGYRQGLREMKTS